MNDSTVNPALKQCITCKNYFDPTPENFPLQKGTPDGLSGVCITCRRAYKREWAKRNRKSRAANPNPPPKPVKLIPPIGYKYCSKGSDCVNPQGPLLPATIEYFTANPLTKDGMYGACRCCRRKKQHQWHESNRDKVSARGKEWYQDNKPGKLAKSKVWASEHPEQMKAYIQKWKENNPDAYKQAVKTGNQRRRARQLGLPEDFTKDDWQHALAYFNNRCAVCGCTPDFWTNLAMDHWIPLSNPNSLGTVKKNIVPLCNTRVDRKKPVGILACNQSKKEKHPEEWLVKRFGKRKAKQILKRIHAYFDQL